MKLIIESTTNGAVVTTDTEFEDDQPEKTCYEFDEEKPEGFVNLLWEVIGSLGDYGKYSKLRPVVKLEHGDHYECKDKKCEICKEVG